MRVSVFNICTSALDLLKFSSKMAIDNAGTKDFDYIIVLWEPSEEVYEWMGVAQKKYGNIIGGIHKTDKNLSFIENLRECFNIGFDIGFKHNDYTCGINTDMAFYKNWLLNLVKYANENSIINCRQIEPNPSIHHELGNFGDTINGMFKLEDWNMFCSRIYEDRLITEEEWQKIRNNVSVRADATPHLIHKSIWERVGPWQVKTLADMNWFNKAKSLGIKNMKSIGSIVYHRGAQETIRRKPTWKLKA